MVEKNKTVEYTSVGFSKIWKILDIDMKRYAISVHLRKDFHEVRFTAMNAFYEFWGKLEEPCIWGKVWGVRQNAGMVLLDNFLDHRNCRVLLLDSSCICKPWQKLFGQDSSPAQVSSFGKDLHLAVELRALATVLLWNVSSQWSGVCRGIFAMWAFVDSWMRLLRSVWVVFGGFSRKTVLSWHWNAFFCHWLW